MAAIKAIFSSRDPLHLFILIAAMLLTSLVTASAAPVYPLKVSSNGRYLVDQKNTPFLIAADGVDAVIARLAPADYETYLTSRQAHGYNAIWFQSIVETHYGGNADLSAADGTLPFTTPGDFSTPNEAYFAKIDDYIKRAAAHGMLVFLSPIETGGNWPLIVNNGTAKGYKYGAYLGNRFKNFPNVFYIGGNDYDDTPERNAYLGAIMDGIRSTDPGHLQTFEYNSEQDALDDSCFAPHASLNGSYTFKATYHALFREHLQSSSVPAWLGEGHYNGAKWGGELGTPNLLRRQEYWTMLSWGAGRLQGDASMVFFSAGWRNSLTAPDAVQAGYWQSFFAPRAWYEFVPDQAHTVVTAGYGTLGPKDTLVSASDYLTAAHTPDGSLVVAYMPTNRTITVDMTRLSGTATARWFDPTKGAYTNVSGSPFANTNSKQQFTPPGKNSAGDGDWVLVLEAASGAR